MKLKRLDFNSLKVERGREIERSILFGWSVGWSVGWLVGYLFYTMSNLVW